MKGGGRVKWGGGVESVKVGRVERGACRTGSLTTALAEETPLKTARATSTVTSLKAAIVLCWKEN